MRYACAGTPSARQSWWAATAGKGRDACKSNVNIVGGESACRLLRRLQDAAVDTAVDTARAAYEDGEVVRRFEGKVIVVTGAGSGIGRATAARLLEEGAAVALCDRAFGSALPGDGHARALRVDLDVASEEAVARAFSTVADQFGGIDGLANVAGVFRSGPFLAEGGDAATLTELFDTNVRGVAHCLRAAIPHLRRRPSGGAMVTVASQSSKVLRFEQALYGASKAAASYLTKAVGLEVAADRIRCNVVHPGVTESGMTRAMWDRGLGSEGAHVAGSLSRFRVPIPLGRIGRPEDVAAAVCFLLSEDAAHVTMTEIVVDGGSQILP